MKYSPQIYSELLIDALKDGWRSEHVHKFLSFVRRNGDFSKLPQIIRNFKKRYNRVHGLRDVEVRIVRENPHAAHSVREALGMTYDPSIVIDKDILGGMIVTVDGETVVDGSVKTRIWRLFK